MADPVPNASRDASPEAPTKSNERQLPKNTNSAIFGRASLDVKPFDPLLLPSLAMASTSVLSELQASADPLASDRYGCSLLCDDNGEDDDPASQATEHRYSLTWEKSGDLQVTCIDWNSRGLILAAAYGSRSGNTCEEASSVVEMGALVVWDLAQRGFDPTAPSRVIEHSAHLSYAVAHPDKPGVIAAGSIDGEVIVFDLAQVEQPVVACSNIGQYFHQEAVTSLAWRYDALLGDWLLCSVSRDGKLLVWNVNNKLKYPIQGQSFGFGIESLAVSPSEIGDILVGSECGTLQRASLSTDAGKPTNAKGAKMKWSSNALEAIARVPPERRGELVQAIEDRAKRKKKKGIDTLAILDAKPPIELIYPNLSDCTYDCHLGAVNSVDANPFETKLFLSCSNDGELRLHRTGQQQHVLVIEPPSLTKDPSRIPITDAKFSPAKPTVMAAGLADGRICFYDADTAADTFTAKERGGGQQAGVKSIAFNAKLPKLFASGNSNGTIDIWRLAKKLYRRSPTDSTALEKSLSFHTNAE